MEVEEKKRPAGGLPEDAPAAKKPNIPDVTPKEEDRTGPITFEDIELFQKEALYRQMNVYKRERDAAQAQLDALRSGDIDAALKSELQRVNELYLEASKRIERSESRSLARCALENVKGGEKPAESEDADKKAKEADEHTLQKLVEIQEELLGVQSLAEKRASQLLKASDRHAELEAKIRELELKLVELPQETLRQYESYRLVEQRIQDLTVDNTKLEQELTLVRQALGDAKSEQAAFEHGVRAQVTEERAELEKRLDVAETDVARLRAARDDILGELNVRKAAEQDRIKSTDQLKELLAAAEERIKASSRSEPPEVDSAGIEALAEPELRERAIKLARQNKALAAELPALEQAFSQMRAKAMAKVSDLAATEAKISALTASKARADEKYFSAMRARDAVTLENTKIKSSLAKTAEVVTGLKEIEQKLTGDVTRLQRQLGEAGSKVTQLERNKVAHDRRHVELASQLESARKQITKLSADLKGRDAETSAQQTAKHDLEATIEKLKRQLETKRATSGNGSATALQEQIESLRSIALCSLCTKNWKDTAIKLCGHVFCHECAQARLAARMRKCPMCNVLFGQNDLLTVHL